jgi:hypothetical protein
MSKSRRMRWEGHVAHMVKVGKPEEKNHSEDLGVDRG